MTFDGLFKWQNSYKFHKNLPNVPQTDMNAFGIYLCIFEKDSYSSNDILLQISDILNTPPPPPHVNRILTNLYSGCLRMILDNSIQLWRGGGRDYL